MAAIFGSSSVSEPPELPGGLSDKVVHAGIYAGLGAVLLRALAGAIWAGVTINRGAATVVGAAAYGLSDELHQRFVPGRTFDPYDLLVDAIGAAAAVGAIFAWGIIHGHVIGESAPRA